jgi:hypothetical protein
VRGSPDVSRFSGRRQARLSSQPPAEPSPHATPAGDPARAPDSRAADAHTQPLDGPIESETIEEYIEP